MKIPANYYQQFDADYSRAVPAEGYGGWKKREVEIDPQHTALVVMHAWDVGTREQFAGWHQAVEFFPRAIEICETVFPPLLSAVRASPMKVFHVIGGGGSCAFKNNYPGYHRAVALAGAEPPPLTQVPSDPTHEALTNFRFNEGFPGEHNMPDIGKGFARLDFPVQAKPVGDEGVAQTTPQLLALCLDAKVNHLIYVGFAINWCLLLSPGGMLDMCRHGLFCSTIREAVTAVENKETAREELNKQIALWRVAVAFGLVFDLQDFLTSIKQPR